MQTSSQITLLSCILVMLTAVSSSWGEWQPSSTDNDESPSPADDIESWNEEEQPVDPWTWFGMGYESRLPGSGIAATRAQNIEPNK